MAIANLIISIVLLGQTLHFETAFTESEKQMGLMYRKDWGEIDGMLFVYKNPQPVAYWMKNTYLDMYMLYIDKDFNILEVYHPKVLSEDIVASTNQNIQYVLEIKPDILDLITKHPKDFKAQMKKASKNPPK